MENDVKALDPKIVQRMVGERITECRKKKGVKQAELADILGKSLTTVQRYESGEIDLSISTLIKISKALDVSLFYLLSYQPTLFDYLSPTVQTILERWEKQSDNELRTMTAAELMNCTESDLLLIKLITELKTKPFIPRCPGAGISFCNAHNRHRINELLEYFYGEKGEGNHV